MLVHLTADYLLFKLKALLRPFGHIFKYLWSAVILFSGVFFCLFVFGNSKQGASSQNLSEYLIQIEDEV